MNRWKPFLRRGAIGSAVVLPVLGIVALVWSRVVYTLPAPPPAPAPPWPNAYDTLRQAGRVAVLRDGDVRAERLRENGTAPARRRLLEKNLPALVRVRQAIEQPYLRPPYRRIKSAGGPGAGNRELARLLVFTSAVREAEGDLPEASRCAADDVALGIVTAHGGANIGLLSAIAIEQLGIQRLRELEPRLDAATCRALARRLETLERRRWSAAEAQEKDFQDMMPFARLLFSEGPLATWRNSAELLTLTENAPTGTSALRWRARLVLEGPRRALETADRWNRTQVDFLERPWRSARPPKPPAWNPLEGVFDTLGVTAVVALKGQAGAALLRTRLALRAYRLDHGAYPATLNELLRAGYLSAAPIDPFSSTRAPLGYRRDRADRMRLWSVGPDAGGGDLLAG